MLLFGSTMMTIEGITVFPDHANANLFWYLPGPVRLARRSEDGEAAFTFIKYRPAAVAVGARGGGFLSFVVNMQSDPILQYRIVSKLAAITRGAPTLLPVPFDEGSVQCVALNLQGSGGTTAPPGAFNAVAQILGATQPALYGNNDASFSLTLTQEGATILEQAFEQGTTPVGVIYNLKFTGMRPALDVEITADFKRIYDEFSASLTGQYYFLSVGIEAGFEKLVQDGAITVKVTNYTTDADKKQKEEWALNFFRDKLLADWFEPTLTPGQLAGGTIQQPTLQSVQKQGTELRPPATPPPPKDGKTSSSLPDLSKSPAAGSGQGDKKTGVLPLSPGAPTGLNSGSILPAPTAGSGSPPPSSKRQPPVAAGLGFKPPVPGNTAKGLSSGSSGTPTIAFKLKFIQQEELKTLTFKYSSSEAAQRTYAPQAFFGLLVADLNKAKHFVEIDLDDPFFRVFSVSIDAPIDFARIGLTSAHTALDYGNPQDPTTLKHGDFIFDTQNKVRQKFDVFMSKNYDTSYAYQTQYQFDPASSWVGQKFDYELAAKKTENRTLLLNPFENLGFLEVRVFPNRIDKGVVLSTDVYLHYQDIGGWTQDQLFTVSADSAPQFWRLRLSDPAALSYTYHSVHHLKDGSTKASVPIVTRATALPVDDPFEGALDITFVPLFDPRLVRLAFIDVDYSDSDNNYDRSERLTLQGNAIDPVTLHLSIIDPAKRTFRYRFTFVGTDNQMQRGPFIDTTETLLGVKL